MDPQMKKDKDVLDIPPRCKFILPRLPDIRLSLSLSLSLRTRCPRWTGRVCWMRSSGFLGGRWHLGELRGILRECEIVDCCIEVMRWM